MNPKTEREVTIYYPQKMGTIGTFDIFSEDVTAKSTTTDNNNMDSTEKVPIDGAHPSSPNLDNQSKWAPMDTDLPSYFVARGHLEVENS